MVFSINFKQSTSSPASLVNNNQGIMSRTDKSRQVDQFVKDFKLELRETSDLKTVFDECLIKGGTDLAFQFTQRVSGYSDRGVIELLKNLKTDQALEYIRKFKNPNNRFYGICSFKLFEILTAEKDQKKLCELFHEFGECENICYRNAVGCRFEAFLTAEKDMNEALRLVREFRNIFPSSCEGKLIDILDLEKNSYKKSQLIMEFSEQFSFVCGAEFF